MKLLISMLALLPSVLHAQGIPDTGNSKLWEMRKKVQQRSAQRAGSYVEQMNQALVAGDAAGAESALKSAIAQGTLTQPQIDEARGRIDAMVSTQQRAMAEAERAKMAAAQAQAEAARNTAASSGGNRSGGGVAAKPGVVVVRIKGSGMFWVQSAKVFNLDEQGRETTRRPASSPGDITGGDTMGPRGNTSYMLAFVHPGEGNATAGRYGFKATWTHLDHKGLLKPDEVDARADLEGTFTIPAGAREVQIEYDKYSPNKIRVQSFK